METKLNFVLQFKNISQMQANKNFPGSRWIVFFMVCKANYYSCLCLWKAWGDPQALSYTPENQQKTWALPSCSSTLAIFSLNIPRKWKVSATCLCQHSLKSQFYNLPIVNEKYRLSPVHMIHVCEGDRRCLNLHNVFSFRMWNHRFISFNSYTYYVR